MPHTSQGKQLVGDEYGRVILMPVEGLLPPLAKIFLHNVARPCKSIYTELLVSIGRNVCYKSSLLLLTLRVCCSRSRQPYAKAHVLRGSLAPAAP